MQMIQHPIVYLHTHCSYCMNEFEVAMGWEVEKAGGGEVVYAAINLFAYFMAPKLRIPSYELLKGLGASSVQNRN